MRDVIDTFPHLLKGRTFTLSELATSDGRVEVYEAPIPGADYVIGFDGAMGIQDRDFDAGVVLVKDSAGEEARQVCEVHGHWGERLDRLLYALHVYYNNALIVGERQFGLATLRRLNDEYECERLYYERREIAANRRYTDALGHPKVHKDLVLRNLRRAIMEQQILVRSRLLLDQMQRLEFYAPGEDPSTGITKGDEALRVRLPKGGSPDLVMAAAYAWLGWGQLIHYPPPAAKWGPDTLGHLLDHAQPGEEDRQGNASTFNKRLRQRR